MPFAATPDTLAGADYTFAAASCDELPARALTLREQRDYEALPHAARQRDWLAGRHAAKRAISARWNIPAAEIELRSTPGAAPQPYVRRGTHSWSPLPDRLTIAHCDGVAIAVASAATSSFGVDLERAAEVSPLELRYVVSESERSDLCGIDPTLIWLLKEAAWKALSLTPTESLSSLQLVFAPATQKLVGVRHGTRELRARADVWRVLACQSLIAALVEIAPEVS